MKNILLIIAAITFSNSIIYSQEAFKITDDYYVEKSVEPFSELSIEGVFNVVLLQNNNEMVGIGGDQESVENVIIESDGGHLMVKTKKNFSLKGSKKLNVYISFINLEELAIHGVGNVKCQNQLNLDGLELEIEGIGNTELNLKCNRLETNISAVGNVSLSGSANHTELDHSGVGNLKAEDFKVVTLNLNASGVGNVDVYAEENLSIKSSGVGNVSYHGPAKITSMDVSGIGKVRKL